MNKKTIYLPFVIIVLFILSAIFFSSNKDNKLKDNKLDDDNKIYNILGTINSNDENLLTIINNDKELLKFENKVVKEKTGTKLSLECTGEINPSKDIQNCEIINYEVIDNSDIPEEWLDDGIFKDYYLEAFEKLNTLSIDEKIAQIMLVRYNENNIKEYQFGGYIFFEKDFKNKSKDEVINMINSLQSSYQIPLLIAADEEGGIVTRISSNKNLVSEPFKSSQELYKEGGFNAIKEDVIAKSKILSEIGINLNLAPVVDVSTNEEDYIYKRTLGLNTEMVSIYADTVISASKETNVSYTLKHFPGYGSNLDTHKTGSLDYKSYDDLLKYDIPPFQKGIEAGAEAIMNSHNTVMAIDSNNPISLSQEAHNFLRNTLQFTGIIITDDLDMSALNDIQNVYLKAFLAGNDLLIVSDYEKCFNNLKDSYNNGLIDENELNHKVFRLLAWKYYKGLL